MLSLKTYDIPTLEVEAPDGEILHVLPASKRHVQKIAAMEAGSPDALGELYSILAECLSENREGRKFTEADLENIPIPVIQALMIKYTRFIHEKVDTAKN